ncbi:hypothetical protein JAAARDRAFT_40451 [Jaapia argillacea MUCL 33604]|uniref:separase n=1 Tax=Jaapia argillacea MUCL 33604 TaxID=933084 RepID=A0A067PBD5_9AGAM|nr:hypothetical protein JAAARDRAFT_40451 [Jaapia argillacea MUCL 33604]
MPTASQPTKRRPPTSRAPPKPITVNDLADKLASGLVIDAKAHRNAPAHKSGEDRAAAMRSVNAASQTLSALAQTGWRAAQKSTATSGNLSKVTSCVQSAKKSLQLLRKGTTEKDAVDVERAACSMSGKLIALELFIVSLDILSDMHPMMLKLLNPSETPSGLIHAGQLHLLSLPLPPSTNDPMDPIQLTLLSTYLLNTLQSLSYSCLDANPDQSPSFTSTLFDTPSLLHWIPHFTHLPAKHTDSILTRAYTALVKASNSISQSPTHSPQAFRARCYALCCLLSTSPSTIQPDTFWDQALKFVTTFVKSVASSSTVSEMEAMDLVSEGLCQVVEGAEAREDRREFVNGRAFVGFCEYWMGIATRKGDLAIVDRISSLMQRVSTSPSVTPSSSSEDVIKVDAEPQPVGVDDSSNPAPTGRTSKEKDKTTIDAAKICATLTQVTALLEQWKAGDDANDDVTRRVQDGKACLARSSSFLIYESDASEEDRDEGLSRASAKVKRALEKLRRVAVKLVETTASSHGVVVNGVRDLLSDIVEVLEIACKQKSASDLISPALETLFVLARTSLVPTNPDTYTPSYNLLIRASSLIGLSISPKGEISSPTSDSSSHPNFVRCLSGAFHNIALTLYHAEKYGGAVRFLRVGCPLGRMALSMRKGDGEGEKLEDAWRQMKEQLHRRWELLGVCYSKMGDRQLAYDASVQSILSFPLSEPPLLQLVNSSLPSQMFEMSPVHRQLGVVVDRVTYMGVCELFKAPEDVSLKSALQQLYGVAELSSVVGALIERQIDGLEGSIWKENVRTATKCLLLDALSVYDQQKRPVKRARVLLRCLEVTYKGGQDASGLDEVSGRPLGDVGQEVEALLTREDFGCDANLAHLSTQYRATAHVWLALHAHRRADPLQSTLVAEHVDEACRLLRTLVLLPQSQPKGVMSPKGLAASRRGSGKKVLNAARAVTVVKSRVSRVPKRAPVTPPRPARKALEAVSLNAPQATPTQSTEVKKPVLMLDDIEKLITLLQTASHLVGLLGLVVVKIRTLNVIRRLSERNVATNGDAYIKSSVDLAHEYVKLGKNERAGKIFTQALEVARGPQSSEEVRVLFYLRFAESLAVIDNVLKSSTVYCEALGLADALTIEEKGLSTAQRVRVRVYRLERAAMAASTFAIIQYSKDDPSTSLNGLLQSLRLWNRAMENLTRLGPSVAPTSKPTQPSNPFDMADIKDALTNTSGGVDSQADSLPKTPRSTSSTDGLEWRIAEGLLSTLFALAQAYFHRGFAREAEYFIEQARDLAESLNIPAILSRALAKKGEILLSLGHLDQSHQCIMKAAELLGECLGPDAADIRRLHGQYAQVTGRGEDAQVMYDEAITILAELNKVFVSMDTLTLRRSSVVGPKSPKTKSPEETLAPELLASILKQQIWLLREDGGDGFQAVISKFLGLPPSAETKAEEDGLMARLTLRDVFDRFRSDMFLSSLTDSTISLPMGLSADKIFSLSPASQDVLMSLGQAEKLFWANLAFTSRKGTVRSVRDAAVSLALIRALQTSLGNGSEESTTLAANILNNSSAITLRREMLEAIQHKFLDSQSPDDLKWPLITPNGSPLPQPTSRKPVRQVSGYDSGDEDDVLDDPTLREYWSTIREKYYSQTFSPTSLSPSPIDQLPSNWTVITINLTSDKNTIFISRQRPHSSPLIFCLPLKGRRDNEDDEHLTFDDAMAELREIIRLSDESAKRASVVRLSEDKNARAEWWAERTELDGRMKELLENIEFCWLGAFKTILSPAMSNSADLLEMVRMRLEKIFAPILPAQDKAKQKHQRKTLSRTRSERSQARSDSQTPQSDATTQSQSQANQSTTNTQTRTRPSTSRTNTYSHPTSSHPTTFSFSPTLLECFLSLPPKCRDEELEDFVYFILDGYQFCGVQVAIAEVDVDMVGVDLRGLLEEVSFLRSKAPSSEAKEGGAGEDGHVFLVLDKNVQGIPWESIPVLRGRSVSRIPGVEFLVDRLEFARMQRRGAGSKLGDTPKKSASTQGEEEVVDRGVVDPRNAYYVLNPSGDLKGTEKRFKDWVKDMKKVGWDGVIGRAPSEQEMVDALGKRDLVIYFGHGGAEQYVRSHKIRHLPKCAATMLWGCSSGALREMGEFDRVGTPYNYMLAGCPTLVANLWDVTDRDIDKFSQEVFDRLRLTVRDVKQRATQEGSEKDEMSIVTAVAESRECCKLKYLTGAAPVVYGIPFYL